MRWTAEHDEHGSPHLNVKCDFGAGCWMENRIVGAAEEHELPVEGVGEGKPWLPVGSMELDGRSFEPRLVGHPIEG